MNIRHERTSTTEKFFIDGKEYAKLDDVPQEFRHFFEDRNNDGIPDEMEFGNAFKSFFSKSDTSEANDLRKPGNDYNRGTNLDCPGDTTTPSGTGYRILTIMIAIGIITFLIVLYIAFIK